MSTKVEKLKHINISRTTDMTEGSEIKHLLLFALPMLIGNIFQQFYNMVDSIVVGNYVGANALGAVGVTSAVTFFFFSLCLGLGVGGGIVISQYFGAKNDKYVKKAIINSAYVMIISGIIMSVVGVLLARPVLELLDTPPAIIEDSVLYMKIVCGGTLAVAAYNGVSSMLRALGDSKTPLVFLVVASVVNVVLDLVFVICFEMAVAGVAIATTVAQIIAALGCLIYALKTNEYFRIEKELMAWDLKIVGQIMRIGIPMAAQNALIALSCVVLQKVVNGFGETVVAANTASGRVEQLVQQPFSSLGAAMATFTGQNIGAGRFDRVKRGYHRSIVLVAAFSLFMLAVFVFFSDNIIGVFVKEKEVISLGAKGITIMSFMFFPLGMIYITRSLLNGAGDAFFTILNGIVEVVVRIGASMTLVLIPFIGVWGIWLSGGLTWVAAGGAAVIRYKQGKWKGKSVV